MPDLIRHPTFFEPRREEDGPRLKAGVTVYFCPAMTG